MKKGKKIALFVSMVLVLAVAAVINVVLLTDTNNNGGNENPVGSFFATSRQDRLTTKNYEIEQLDDILSLEGDEYATARTNALAQKQKIVEAMDLELLLETLLRAQGFENVYVAVGTASDTINVIVSKDELAHEDTVRIYNIIATEASISHEYVSITSV